MQKRWAQKEQEIREKMKKSKVGPVANEMGAYQGGVNVASFKCHFFNFILLVLFSLICFCFIDTIVLTLRTSNVG